MGHKTEPTWISHRANSTRLTWRRAYCWVPSSSDWLPDMPPNQSIAGAWQPGTMAIIDLHWQKGVTPMGLQQGFVNPNVSIVCCVSTFCCSQRSPLLEEKLRRLFTARRTQKQSTERVAGHIECDDNVKDPFRCLQLFPDGQWDGFSSPGGLSRLRGYLHQQPVK